MGLIRLLTLDVEEHPDGSSAVMSVTSMDIDTFEGSMQRHPFRFEQGDTDIDLSVWVIEMLAAAAENAGVVISNG